MIEAPLASSEANVRGQLCSGCEETLLSEDVSRKNTPSSSIHGRNTPGKSIQEIDASRE